MSDILKEMRHASESMQKNYYNNDLGYYIKQNNVIKIVHKDLGELTTPLPKGFDYDFDKFLHQRKENGNVVIVTFLKTDEMKIVIK